MSSPQPSKVDFRRWWIPSISQLRAGVPARDTLLGRKLQRACDSWIRSSQKLHKCNSQFLHCRGRCLHQSVWRLWAHWPATKDSKGGWSPNYPQKVRWVSSLSPPLKAQQIDLPQNESFSNSNRARSWREARQHVALWSPRVWDGLRGACQRGRNLRMNFMEILQVQTIHWERDRKSRWRKRLYRALPSPLSWISEGHENGWRVQQKVKGVKGGS